MKQTKIFIVAGEPSGDLLGASLMEKLHSLRPDIDFQGIGGRNMQAAGLSRPIFPIADLTIMGWYEVLPKIPKLLFRLKQTVNAIRRYNPDIIITIDSPGFNFILAKRIKPWFTGKMVHYVSPSVWAYKPQRAETVKKLFDHILLLFPFEKIYYKDFPHTYIGHPIVERERLEKSRRNKKLILFMPGSRKAEIRNHLPILTQVIKKLDSSFKCVICTIPHLYKEFNSIQRLPNVQISTEDNKYLMQTAHFAVIKSGTITLEATKYRLPHIVIYKTSKITARLVRKMINISVISLPNLVLNRPVVPELLQEDCNAGNIYTLLAQLIQDPQAPAFQQKSFDKIMDILGEDTKKPPSHKAAEAVLHLLAKS